MSKRDKYQILIVEDHPVVRRGLASLISATPDLEVCGEAGSAPDALTAVEKLRPDLVTVDLMLRGSDGLDLIKNLHTVAPKLALLVISMHAESTHGERCLRAGARGYLNKDQLAEEILQAIRQVLAGEYYFGPEMMKRLAARAIGDEAQATDPVAQLTDRELQVFQLMGQGLDTRKIAARLCLDPSTVETHRRHLKEKLGLPTTTAVLHFATLWNHTAERRDDLTG